jgi:hypothetical protein
MTSLNSRQKGAFTPAPKQPTPSSASNSQPDAETPPSYALRETDFRLKNLKYQTVKLNINDSQQVNTSKSSRKRPESTQSSNTQNSKRSKVNKQQKQTDACYTIKETTNIFNNSKTKRTINDIYDVFEFRDDDTSNNNKNQNENDNKIFDIRSNNTDNTSTNNKRKSYAFQTTNKSQSTTITAEPECPLKKRKTISSFYDNAKHSQFQKNAKVSRSNSQGADSGSNSSYSTSSRINNQKNLDDFDDLLMTV